MSFNILIRHRLTFGWSGRHAAGIASAMLAMAATLACGGGDAKAPAQQGSGAVPVKVQVAKSEPVNDTTEYVATVKSRRSAVIMPQVEGVITQIYAHSGERVAAGAALLQIDASKQEATVNTQKETLASQQANLAYAKQQYERTSSLYKAGVVSKQEIDQAKAALDAAQAQVQALQASVQQEMVQLHYYKVSAPTSGVVGDIPVRVGDRVTTSTELTTVDKPGDLEAYIYVPIERSSDLKMNLPVELVDAQGNLLGKTRIDFISPQVDNSTQTVLAKAPVPSNDKFRNSQFIRARIIWGTQDHPLVPVVAVSRIGGQFFAFVAESQGGKTVAHQKALQVGQTVGNDYEVLSGIKPGDKVIVSGTQFLVDGTPVIPQG